MIRHGLSAACIGTVMVGIYCVRATGSQEQPNESSQQVGFGKVFEKHDGRRGPSNPYTQRIDEVAKHAISGADAGSSALAARFALMGEPLEEDETPPVPPPPSTTDATQAPASSAKQGSDRSVAAPAVRGERSTRFDQ